MPLTIYNLAHVPEEEGRKSQAARDLFSLAQFPRVFVNFSVGFVRDASQPGSPSAALLEGLLEHFGARRLIWASFYPSMREQPYPQAIADLRRAVAHFSADDQDWLLGGAARDLYPTLKAGQPA
jgi:predicted TIM-barrel fold metal-dependent hydrolase